jgi:acetylornithine/succinyldiaminopimelate/putrescine aminotransferase
MTMDFSEIKETEHRYAIKTGALQNICFLRGEKNTVFDSSDRAYIDMAGGEENCLGYGCPALSEAIKLQAEQIISIPVGYYSKNYGNVMKKLIEGTGFSKACLTASDLEANVLALSIASGYMKENFKRRNRVVVASDTPLEESVFATMEGSMKVISVEYNNYSALKKTLSESTAILILQPVVGSAKFSDYDYMVNAYALCKSLGILVVCDETKVGIGRLGSKFAFSSYGIQPDILTVSTGLGGGLPVGAVLSRGSITDVFQVKPSFFRQENNVLTTTAVGVVLDTLTDEAFKAIVEKGDYLMSKLLKLKKYNFVLDVRGKGLLAAIELSSRIMAVKIVGQMEKLGFLLSAKAGNVIKFSPPFSITHREIDEAAAALSGIFAETNI